MGSLPFISANEFILAYELYLKEYYLLKLIIILHSTHILVNITELQIEGGIEHN